MAQTKDGAALAVATIKERDPDFFKRIGSIGGKRGKTGGFYYAKLNLSEDHPSHPANAGSRGGKLSKRK